jgi:hypothetical protein
MANVVTLQKKSLYVKLDGTNDFVWATATITTGRGVGMKVADAFPEGLALTSIIYSPPSAGAVGLARDALVTGEVIPPRFRGVSGDTLSVFKTGDDFYKPCLEHDDQTTDTNAEWWFEFNNLALI